MSELGRMIGDNAVKAAQQRTEATLTDAEINQIRDGFTHIPCQDTNFCNEPDVFRAVERIVAARENAAARRALETAQKALAGEDTVEWAREARGSHISYPTAVGILDDLIDDLLDDRSHDDPETLQAEHDAACEPADLDPERDKDYTLDGER